MLEDSAREVNFIDFMETVVFLFQLLNFVRCCRTSLISMTTLPLFPQALREEPMHAGRQGMHSGAKLHLLPLPVCGVQHVRPTRPLPGVCGPRAGRHAAFRLGGRTWAGPLQRAAFWQTNRDPPPGDAHHGSCYSGGRGGDERAGAKLPAGPLPHQGHPVCVPLRVLGGWLMGGGLGFIRV